MTAPDAMAPAAWATDPAFVDVDGLWTAYRRAGAGEPVLYLHGGGLTGLWLAFLDRLAGRFDVVAPEHPGFGDTAAMSGPIGFDDLVLHLDAFLDTLGLERVHLVGHSLGGWLAAELAVFYPRRFASLTLITPAGLRLVDVDSIDVFRMTPEHAASALFNGREERFGDLLAPGDDLAGLTRAFDERAAAAALTWNPRYDRKLDTRLSRVRAPTLVLGAQEDRIVPTPMAARYAELIPGGRLVTVEGGAAEPSGHLIHVEHPEQVAEIVARHVDAARQSRSTESHQEESKG